MNDVVVRITLPGTVDRAWAHLRRPELIARWHGWEAPELAEEIEVIYRDEAVVEEEGHRLRIGGHLFVLEGQRSETLVTVSRADPVESADPVDWESTYDEVDEGWLSFLQQLRFALTHHPDDDRRTVYMGGLARSPERGSPLQQMGVGELAGAWPGDPYQADTVLGDRLTGEVWFRNPHQIGLTVDDWGPGLLLVATAPGDPSAERAAVTITTYDHPDHDGLADRWRRWWVDHYRPAE